MTTSNVYRVRRTSDEKAQDTFKILLSPSALVLLGLKPGDVCTIKTSEGEAGSAIAWSTSGTSDDVVQVSTALRKLYNLELKSRITFSPSPETIKNVSEITFCEVTGDVPDSPQPTLNKFDRLCWAWLLKFALRKADVLSPGQIFEMNHPETRSFKIRSINNCDQSALYRVRGKCEINVAEEPAIDEALYHPFVNEDGMGGLSSQVQLINEAISSSIKLAEHDYDLPDWCRQLGCGGLLLYGAPGTGKSLCLRKIAEAGWREVIWLDPKMLNQTYVEHEATVVQTFTKALRTQPSVIIIDSFDAHEDTKQVEQTGWRSQMSELLGSQLDRLIDSHTLVVAAALSLSSIDPKLKRPGRFTTFIEMPVPNSESRAEILKVLAELPRDSAHRILDNVAARTHGFVGADLCLLFATTVQLHMRRTQSSISSSDEKERQQLAIDTSLINLETDFEKALSGARPSAMHDIIIESPNVGWADIGGQQEVKDMLERKLVWPLKYPDLHKEFNHKPSKGLLLYGPPGCSKTMTAKAAATASGLNFLLVKGAELTSMYVGESERKLREIFSKARAVRPSILFFDEIDAIGAGGSTTTSSGVQTVTTLLNELDGFQALEGVFVLAATNKPETLDPALIRAGRLNPCVYVGLPDREARRDIFKIAMRKTPLDDDIDDKALWDATDGYSGAEIAQVCEMVRDVAIEECIKSNGKRMVSQKHFNRALTEIEASTTSEMVDHYKSWGASRRKY